MLAPQPPQEAARGVVFGQHMRGKRVQPLAMRVEQQRCRQQPPDAEPVIGIHDPDRELRHRIPGIGPHRMDHAHRGLRRVGHVERPPGEVEHPVRIEQPLDHPVGRAGPAGEEPQIARARAHPRDPFAQPVLVLRGHGADAHLAPVRQPRDDRGLAAGPRPAQPSIPAHIVIHRPSFAAPRVTRGAG